MGGLQTKHGRLSFFAHPESFYVFIVVSCLLKKNAVLPDFTTDVRRRTDCVEKNRDGRDDNKPGKEYVAENRPRDRKRRGDDAYREKPITVFFPMRIFKCSPYDSAPFRVFFLRGGRARRLPLVLREGHGYCRAYFRCESYIVHAKKELGIKNHELRENALRAFSKNYS